MVRQVMRTVVRAATAITTAWVLAAALLVPVASAYVPSPMPATAEPGFIDGLSQAQRQAVTNNVLRAAGIEAMPYTVEAATAQDFYPERVGRVVWQAEAQITEASYGGTNVSSSQLATRIKAGVLPKAKALASRITTRAVPGLGTFLVGWEIGTGIRKLFIDVNADPFVPLPRLITAVNLYPVASEPCYMTFSGCTTFSASQPDRPVIQPGNFWAQFLWKSADGTQSGDAELNLQTEFPCRDISEPTAYRASAGTAYGRCLPELPAHAYYWGPEDWQVNRRPAETKPPHWDGYTTNVNRFAQDFPPLPATATSEAAIEEFLESPAGTQLREFWKWVFTQLPPPGDPSYSDSNAPDPTLDPNKPGSPVSMQVALPAGRGKHKEIYRQELEALGLKAEMDVAPEFDYDIGQNHVVSVSPTPGTIVDRGTTIRIVHNNWYFEMPDCIALHWAACLEELGRRNMVVTKAWAHPADPVTVPKRAVRRTTPEPGARITEMNELVMMEIQTDAARDEKERPCDTATRQQPVYPTDLIESSRYVEVQPIHMFGHPNPMTTVDFRPAYLRYGWTKYNAAEDEWVGWGYFHIAAKHGWDQQVANRTANALRSGLPKPSTRTEAIERTEYFGGSAQRFPVSRPGASQIACTQVVSVERGRTAAEAAAGNPARGIVTTFGMELPGAS